MAKDLTRHQEKIVQRYYEHQETIRVEKLSDLVAELWLCEDEAKATKLWGRAQVALMKAGANPQAVANAVNKRDVTMLATLVQRLDAGQPTGAGGAGASKPTKPEGHQGAELLDGTPLVARGARSLADGRTIEQMRREKAAEGGYDSLEPGNLKRAMNAFKQKLKLMRRDDESQLRGRYTTRGESSKIMAITPPREFPTPVWEELVRQGRLKKSGQGTYQIS